MNKRKAEERANYHVDKSLAKEARRQSLLARRKSWADETLWEHVLAETWNEKNIQPPMNADKRR
jgi:hypothetical protein